MDITPHALLTVRQEQALCNTYDRALQNDAVPRIMLIHSPSNPTDRVYGEENFAVILQFCKQRNITLISDEIYSDIFFGATPPLSPLSDGQLKHDRMILTGGLSKVDT